MSVAGALATPQSAGEGLDEATARLYRSVCESAPHREFIAAIEQLMRETASPPPPTDTTLVIVPAAFYRENPRSGADGHIVRAQAEALGWKVDSIPLANLRQARRHRR